MVFNDVCIESVVNVLPEEIVTSELIEDWLSPVYDRLKLPYGRLELFSGIKERRFCKPGTVPSDIAAQAGLKALKNAGISKEDIGCLINASVCRDFLEPATASVVHEKVGLSEKTMIFDVSNACLGFMNAMMVVANMIERRVIDAALVVAGENGRPLVESTIKFLLEDKSLTRKSIKNSFASLTIGSGAAAAVLVHSSISKTGHFLLGGGYLVESKYNNLCQGDLAGRDSGVNDTDKLLMNTDSEALLNSGCRLAKRTWENTKKLLQIENDDVKRFFCHQVGSAHRNLLFKTLEIDVDKDMSTFPYLGNMGSVSLPATLSIGEGKGLLNKNDLVALLGIGSGINCMMLGVRW
jgi:3-oxoacyl-[acyl-carrier-protein] synthase III